MKKQFLLASLLLGVMHQDVRASDTEAQKVALIAVGTAVVVGGTYVIGRCSAGMLHAWGERQYAAEIDLLARSAYNDHLIDQELIPYVLLAHEKLCNSWLSNPGMYRNYPLLFYKKNLDWFVNNLWFLQIFYIGNDFRDDIQRLVAKLERIKGYIVSDYRFVAEQRRFEERVR